MINIIKRLGLPIALTLVILSGCNRPSNTSEIEMLLEEKDKNIETLLFDSKRIIADKVALEDRVEELEHELAGQPAAPGHQLLGPSSNVLSTSLEVIELIKDKDMDTLSSYVHSTKGLRFTPYFYIDTQNDQHFTAGEVANLGQSTDLLTWGEYDGIGGPISLDFNAYYDQFVYDKDFMNPQMIGNNTPIGSGNTLDNMEQAYPDGHFIEFHFTGLDPQYAGIDWGSLKLVFEEENGLWYLVGIVHGQWTT